MIFVQKLKWSGRILFWNFSSIIYSSLRQCFLPNAIHNSRLLYEIFPIFPQKSVETFSSCFLCRQFEPVLFFQQPQIRRTKKFSNFLHESKSRKRGYQKRFEAKSKINKNLNGENFNSLDSILTVFEFLFIYNTMLSTSDDETFSIPRSIGSIVRSFIYRSDIHMN